MTFIYSEDDCLALLFHRITKLDLGIESCPEITIFPREGPEMDEHLASLHEKIAPWTDGLEGVDSVRLADNLIAKSAATAVVCRLTSRSTGNSAEVLMQSLKSVDETYSKAPATAKCFVFVGLQDRHLKPAAGDLKWFQRPPKAELCKMLHERINRWAPNIEWAPPISLEPVKDREFDEWLDRIGWSDPSQGDQKDRWVREVFGQRTALRMQDIFTHKACDDWLKVVRGVNG
jgi:hypothetical protein